MPPPTKIPLSARMVPHYQKDASPLFYFTPRVACLNGGVWRDQECLLSTATNISILPPALARTMDVDVMPLPGWHGVHVPHWNGVPCTIGRITMEWDAWRKTLLVRVPVRRTAWMRRYPYVLLGTAFLLFTRAKVELQCDPRAPGGPCGELVLP
jgi:hypothetical protein